MPKCHKYIMRKYRVYSCHPFLVMTGFFFDIGGLDSENDMFFFSNRKSETNVRPVYTSKSEGFDTFLFSHISRHRSI